MKKEVGFELGKLNHLLGQYMHEVVFKDKIRPKSVAQVKVVRYLYEHDKEPVYQFHIEEFLGVRRPTVTGILQTMESQGIIERKLSSEDSRKKEIHLKKEVYKEVEQNRKKIKNMENTLTKGFSEEEKNALLEYLERMEQNLLERRKQNEK